MKVEIKQLKKEFQPIKVTLNIETEEELKALYALALTNTSVPETVKTVRWGKLLPKPELLNHMLMDLSNAIECETGLVRDDY